MTAEFDAISLQTAQLLLLYQSVKVEKTRHGSPQETPNKTPTHCSYLDIHISRKIRVFLVYESWRLRYSNLVHDQQLVLL